MPAAIGHDMDVPDRTAYEPSARGYVDRMRPPGAENCGFRSTSYVGPQLEYWLMVPGVAVLGGLRSCFESLWGLVKVTDTLEPAARALTQVTPWAARTMPTAVTKLSEAPRPGDMVPSTLL